MTIQSLQCDYKNVLKGLLISHSHNQEVGRRWGKDRGLGGQEWPSFLEHGYGQQVPRTKSCCVTITWFLGKSQLTSQVLTPHPVLGAHSSPRPVLVSPRLSDTPSSGRSQAVLAALPLEDNSCSFLSLPVAQAEHLQLFSQASRCFSAHSAIPPSLPGPELA